MQSMTQSRDQPIEKDYSDDPVWMILPVRGYSAKVLRAIERITKGNGMITQSRLRRMANFLFVLLVACFPVR